MAKRTKAQESERKEAIRYLQEYLWDGKGRPAQVFANVEHVSRSGMSRVISFRVPMLADDKTSANGVRFGFYHVTHLFSKVLGWPMTPIRDGLRVQGCGMDMIFHTLDCVVQAIAHDAMPNASYEDRRKAFPMPDYRSL